MRVLYVEDNQQLRESIAMLLQADGREITTCVCAEDAGELDAQKPFDLVITDVTLPGMSGIEWASRLLGADPDRWIVLCSGHHLSDELKALGGSHVHALAKPFGIDQLEALVNDAEAALR